MKKSLLLVLLALLIYSCSGINSEPTNPNVDPNKGSVSITLPGAGRSAGGAANQQVASYSIELEGVDVVYSLVKTGLPGQTVTFDRLLPGNYSITVKGNDSAMNCILIGSSPAAVVAGQSTAVTIQLAWVTGEIIVGVILPGSGQGGNPGPQRIQRSGPLYFAYNADGLVTQLDDTDEFNPNTETYTIQNGKRVSSVVTGLHDPVSFEIYITPQVLMNSVIGHDTLGRETSIKYTYVGDGRPLQEILVSYSAVGKTETRNIYELKQSTDPNVIIDPADPASYNVKLVSIKEFDSKGRILSEEYHHGSFYTYWFPYQGRNPGDVIKLTYDYYQQTWHRIGETLYLNGQLLTKTTFIVKAPGVYQYGCQKTAQGHLLYEIYFGNIFSYSADLYAQSVTINPVDTWRLNQLEIPFETWFNVNEIRNQTNLYSVDFEGLGTTTYPLNLEAGSMAEGQVFYQYHS